MIPPTIATTAPIISQSPMIRRRLPSRIKRRNFSSLVSAVTRRIQMAPTRPLRILAPMIRGQRPRRAGNTTAPGVEPGTVFSHQPLSTDGPRESNRGYSRGSRSAYQKDLP